MNKYEFLAKLSKKLDGLPADEVKERLNFYAEMIDDGIEEGLSEEEAVAKIGDTDEIATKINTEESENPTEKRKLKAWEIVLIVLGSPLWIALAAAAFAVALSLYVSLWAVIVSLWAVFASLVGSAAGGLALAVLSFCKAEWLTAVALIGACLVCAGLSVFALYGCKALTKAVIFLTKKFFTRRRQGDE